MVRGTIDWSSAAEAPRLGTYDLEMEPVMRTSCLALLMIVACGGADPSAAPDGGITIDAGPEPEGPWQRERAGDGRPVRRLLAPGAHEGVAVGGGQLVLRRDDTGTWQPLATASLGELLAPFPAPRGELHDAMFDGAGRLRVAGLLGAGHGGLLSLRDGAWVVDLDEAAGSTIIAGEAIVSLAPAPCGEDCTAVYAVFASGILIHHVGGSLTRLTSGEPINQVRAAVNEGGLVGVGHGVFIPVGDAWHRIAAPPEGDDVLRTIYNADDTFMVAVGDQGLVMRVTDTGWIAEQLPDDLLDVHGTAAADVWTVGAGGLVRHFDGQAWQAIEPPPGGHDLTAVAVTATAVWVADAEGSIYRLDR
jgi:hypothetical protein